jgi:hypothetical protein
MKFCAAILALTLLAGCSNSKPETPAAPAPVPAIKPPDERAALQFLADLGQAQSDFHKTTRRYALAYDELIDGHFLKAEPSSDKTGYEIKMRPAADAESYAVTATPLKPGETTHYFFMDQTGLVRAEVGKVATAASPKFST